MRDHLGQHLIGSDLGFARGVLLLDDCEGTFVWEFGGTGGDDVYDMHGDAAFRGSKGMRLITRATGPVVGDGISVRRSLSYPESGLMVWRLRLCMPDVSQVGNVAFNVGLANGVSRYGATFLWLVNVPLVMYFNDALGLSVLPGIGAGAADGAWWQVEMVLDLRAMCYVRAVMNGVAVDMAGLGFGLVAVDTDRFLEVKVSYVTAVAAAVKLYLDEIYVGEFVDV